MAGKKLVLMPGAYDALSARVIEAEGFEAIVAGGYAGVGSMLAQADMGQSNMRDYASHYGRICDAVEIPVYVDADTGFGGVNNVRQMVRAFEEAGVAGLFISDQVFPNRCGYLPGKQIVPVEQMLAKVKAALDARRDPDLFIAARTDAASVEGLDEAIGRCQLFMEAGADMAKPMGFDTIPEIKRAMREIPGPHMATLSQAAGPKARSLSELEAAGVCSATFPSIALFAAAQRGAQRAARCSSAATRSRPARSISFRSTTTTISSGSRICWRARKATTRRPPRWCRSARLNSRGVCDVGVGVSAGRGRRPWCSVFPAARRRRARRSSTRAASFTLVVGYEVGNDYDIGARLLAKYLTRQLPGQPTIVVQNMPQAAALASANYIYVRAPRDGSVLGSISRNLREPGGDEAAQHRGRCAPLQLARRDLVPRPHLRRDRGGAGEKYRRPVQARRCWSAASASAPRPASCRP